MLKIVRIAKGAIIVMNTPLSKIFRQLNYIAIKLF